MFLTSTFETSQSTQLEIFPCLLFHHQHCHHYQHHYLNFASQLGKQYFFRSFSSNGYSYIRIAHHLTSSHNANTTVFFTSYGLIRNLYGKDLKILLTNSSSKIILPSEYEVLAILRSLVLPSAIYSCSCILRFSNSIKTFFKFRMFYPVISFMSVLKNAPSILAVIFLYQLIDVNSIGNSIKCLEITAKCLNLSLEILINKLKKRNSISIRLDGSSIDFYNTIYHSYVNGLGINSHHLLPKNITGANKNGARVIVPPSLCTFMHTKIYKDPKISPNKLLIALL